MSSPVRDRLFRGYGPLIGFAVAFLVIALVVPSQQREVRVESSASKSARSGTGADDELVGTDTTLPTDTAVVDPALAAGGAGGGSAGGGGTGKAGAGRGGAANSGPPVIAGCGPSQVPGDPYSPVCVQFAGNNGGNTARGVTATEITVTARVGGLTSGLVDALSKQASSKVPDEPPEVVKRTIEGLVEFFNKRFQFYGRKIKLVMFDGKGNPLTELTGGGQEGAQADAITVAQDTGAFAEMAAISVPYADALSAKQVVNVGVPYASREWMTQHRPYAWSQFIDCSSAVESVTSYYATKLAGGAAALAGGDLKGKPRATAIVSPENSWYQECVQSGIAQLQRAGKAGDLKLPGEKYKIDINTMSTQADTLVRKLKANGITTVVCGCDPLLLTFMTAAAQQQGYTPEWVITGVAFVDNDLIGQILDQGQWSRAFGVSYSGPTQPAQASLGYRAYKSVRKDEPTIGVDLIYNQLYMLAIGIQGAGPNLTPQTFEKGMFDYPAHTGPYGTWKYGPNDYTSSDDAREIFYDPNGVSPYNRAPGVYRNPNGDARFPIGKWNPNPPRSAAG